MPESKEVLLQKRIRDLLKKQEIQTERVPNGQGWKFFYFILFYFCLFAFSRATPVVHGGSQARGLIGAVAASLPRVTATRDPSHICDL